MPEKTYTHDEVYASALKYFNGDDLAAETWTNKYAMKNVKKEFLEISPDDMHKRMAREFARIEKKYDRKNKDRHPHGFSEHYKKSEDLTEEKILSYFNNFRYIVPGGSVMQCLGNHQIIGSLSNCVVIESPYDSYGGILYTDEQLVHLFKRRCGCGFDLSTLRPDSMPVSNAAGTTTGAVSFMGRYSHTTREVAQRGRRGALMISMDVKHPEAEQFALIKQDLSKVTGANISLRISDEFMKAVINDKEYVQCFPIDSDKPIFTKTIKAKELWNTIVKCAHHTGEPGIMFWDRHHWYSPSSVYPQYKNKSTNPCSEISMSSDDSCRLTSLNFFGFVNNPFTDKAEFDYETLYTVTYDAQRIMDDLVDLELEAVEKIMQKIKSDPEPDYIKQIEMDTWKRLYDSGKNGRRTGLGFTALADTIAALNIKLDSDESLKTVKKIMKTKCQAEFDSSIDMAIERGKFDGFDPEIENTSDFIKMMKKEFSDTYERMMKHGRRNVSISTVAPTGSISILTQTSSGIEPVFKIHYTRRKKINPNDKHVRIDFTDPSGDNWQEFPVIHPKFKIWMDITKETDVKKSPYHGATALEIDWKKRIEIQALVQVYTTHSISACLLAGENYIFTNKGIFEISELSSHANEKEFSDIKLDNLSSVNVNNKNSRITQCYNNGIAEIMKIKLVNGYEITCTSNHMLCVLGKDYKLEWKKVSDLNKKDIVIGRIGLNLWNKSSENRKLNHLVGKSFEYRKITNSKDVVLPKLMSKELARLLGYLCSDGSVGENGISLTQLKNNVCDDFCELINKLFHIKTGKWYHDKRAKNLIGIPVNSREISKFFQWLGITNHDYIEVPKVIFRSGVEHVKEFIRGVTLDGYVSDGLICVSTSVSKKYLQQLQLLLNNIGIDSNLIVSSEKGSRVFPNGKRYKTKKDWALVLTGTEAGKFIDRIGFAEERKNQEAKTKFKRPERAKIVSGYIPDYGLRGKFRSEILPKIQSLRLYGMMSSVCENWKSKFGLTRGTLQEMSDFGMDIPSILLDNTYMFKKINSIKKYGKGQTFDISVPDGNSYIANGLISHNTVNLPANIPMERVYDVYVEAWKQGLKGITVYQEGSRSGVLISNDASKSDEFKENHAPKRPEKLPARVMRFFNDKEKWICFIGFYKNKPYEVFTGKSENFVIPNHIEDGEIVKIKDKNKKDKDGKPKSRYDFIYKEKSGTEMTIEGLSSSFDKEYWNYAKLISGNLRHGMPLPYTIELITNLNLGSEHLNTWKAGVARMLKRCIPDGVSAVDKKCPLCGDPDGLIYRDGCVYCKSCLKSPKGCS